MLKSSKLILAIILLAFLFRGIFLVAVFPIFKGQDESRHYNTVQYLATNKNEDCQNIEKDENNKIVYTKTNQVKQDLSTYRYSDEIRELAPTIQNIQIRGNYYDKVNFQKSRHNGLGEIEFKNKKHSQIQHFCPPDVAASAFGPEGFSLYQWGAFRIEKLLNAKDIFIRYDFLRIISVLLGVVTILLSYNIFKVVNFSDKQSLILTAIISFQPKFVTYFTNINYDVLLIPLWTGFILVGVLILKKGWNIIRIILLILLLIGAIMTKPSALPLLGLGAFLLGQTIYRKFKVMKNPSQADQQIGKRKVNWAVSVGVILAGVFASYLLLDKVGVTALFSEKYLSLLGVYLSKSLPKIYGSSRDYWGVMAWSANNLTLIYVKIIWLIEWVAWLGLGLWIIIPWFRDVKFKLPSCSILKKNCPIFSFAQSTFDKLKKKCNGKINFKKLKRQKKYFWFMLVAIIVLQLGIRVADWKVFTSSGNLALGTPGRYWLPNVVPHFVLLAIGLKITTSLCTSNKKMSRKYFELILLGFLVLMILYWTYEVVDIIIPRFYL